MRNNTKPIRKTDKLNSTTTLSTRKARKEKQIHRFVCVNSVVTHGLVLFYYFNYNIYSHLIHFAYVYCVTMLVCWARLPKNSRKGITDDTNKFIIELCRPACLFKENFVFINLLRKFLH